MKLAARMSLEVNGTAVTARQLEAFLAVQEAGSQSEAARRLGVSVPVLTGTSPRWRRRQGRSC